MLLKAKISIQQGRGFTLDFQPEKAQLYKGLNNVVECI